MEKISKLIESGQLTLACKIYPKNILFPYVYHILYNLIWDNDTINKSLNADITFRGSLYGDCVNIKHGDISLKYKIHNSSFHIPTEYDKIDTTYSLTFIILHLLYEKKSIINQCLDWLNNNQADKIIEMVGVSNYMITEIYRLYHTHSKIHPIYEDIPTFNTGLSIMVDTKSKDIYFRDQKNNIVNSILYFDRPLKNMRNITKQIFNHLNDVDDGKYLESVYQVIGGW